MVGVQPPSESEAWLRVSDWQAVFELADDPGQPRLRQRALQRTHERNDMRDVAERRRAQQA